MAVKRRSTMHSLHREPSVGARRCAMLRKYISEPQTKRDTSPVGSAVCARYRANVIGYINI